MLPICVLGKTNKQTILFTGQDNKEDCAEARVRGAQLQIQENAGHQEMQALRVGW